MGANGRIKLDGAAIRAGRSSFHICCRGLPIPKAASPRASESTRVMMRL